MENFNLFKSLGLIEYTAISIVSALVLNKNWTYYYDIKYNNVLCVYKNNNDTLFSDDF